ncbi:hypothetical protein ACE2AJ_20015 [Aquihabitans daechungensis]|uniref:hypothetical protein n=1 Tax=Aquihabitans daechungensis TaxID=1052257 RepID=UPI003B9F467C
MSQEGREPVDLVAQALVARLDEHLEYLVWIDAASEHHRGAVAAISTALSQLRAGTYGSCLGCSRKIDLDRLADEPEASTCEECRNHPRALIG